MSAGFLSSLRIHPSPMRSPCFLTSCRLIFLASAPSAAAGAVFRCCSEDGDDRGAKRLALLPVLLPEHRLVDVAERRARASSGVAARSSPMLHSRSSIEERRVVRPEARSSHLLLRLAEPRGRDRGCSAVISLSFPVDAAISRAAILCNRGRRAVRQWQSTAARRQGSEHVSVWLVGMNPSEVIKSNR